MGIYDRDYARDEQQGIWLGKDWSMTTWILVVTFAVFVLQLIFSGGQGGTPLTNYLVLYSNLFSTETLTHPWRILGVFTYGFAHDPHNILHIAGNMFIFWLFARDIESKIGAKPFLWLYLTMVAVAGLGWMLVQNMTPHVNLPVLYGASGGVSGLVALFACWYPKRTIFILGVLPLPMWVFGVFWLLGDINGALGRSADSGKVAFTSHLFGAAYGALYFKTGWSLYSMLPVGLKLKKLRGPKLKVHDPDEDEATLSQQVDEILKKIQDQGQDSLTSREKKIMERASRKYQQKHR